MDSVDSLQQETLKDVGDEAEEELQGSGRRKRKIPLRYSPVLGGGEVDKPKRKYSKRKTKISVFDRYAPDVLPDGGEFECGKCFSCFIVPPALRRASGPYKHKPLPIRWTDPDTRVAVDICTGCAKTDKALEVVRHREGSQELLKQQYDIKTRMFNDTLLKPVIAELQASVTDQIISRLHCPRYSPKICGCTHRFIAAESEGREVGVERVTLMLNVTREAGRLSSQKSYHMVHDCRGSLVRPKRVGLGAGQKKSHDFEGFVLQWRQYYKSTCQLCEDAVENLLMYSRNFLYRRLKTDGQRRRVRDRPQGELKPIDELAKVKCCAVQCTTLAATHPRHLEKWRERAVSGGKAEARKVVAEMLVPSGGRRNPANCYTFINLVTGVGSWIITKIAQQLAANKGSCDLPEHGLKQYWASKKAAKAAVSKSADGSTETDQPGAQTILITNPSDGSGVPSAVLFNPGGSGSGLNMKPVVFINRDAVTLKCVGGVATLGSAAKAPRKSGARDVGGLAPDSVVPPPSAGGSTYTDYLKAFGKSPQIKATVLDNRRKVLASTSLVSPQGGSLSRDSPSPRNQNKALLTLLTGHQRQQEEGGVMGGAVHQGISKDDPPLSFVSDDASSHTSLIISSSAAQQAKVGSLISQLAQLDKKQPPNVNISLLSGYRGMPGHKGLSLSGQSSHLSLSDAVGGECDVEQFVSSLQPDEMTLLKIPSSDDQLCSMVQQVISEESAEGNEQFPGFTMTDSNLIVTVLNDDDASHYTLTDPAHDQVVLMSPASDDIALEELSLGAVEESEVGDLAGPSS